MSRCLSQSRTVGRVLDKNGSYQVSVESFAKNASFILKYPKCPVSLFFECLFVYFAPFVTAFQSQPRKLPLNFINFYIKLSLTGFWNKYFFNGYTTPLNLKYLSLVLGKLGRMHELKCHPRLACALRTGLSRHSRPSLDFRRDFLLTKNAIEPESVIADYPGQTAQANRLTHMH